MRRLLFVFLCFSIFKDASAIDPRLDWQTLETEYFSIHFAQGYQQLAEKAALIAEQAHDDLAARLEWRPVDKTHLILSDQTDLPNGYAMPFPYSRSILFLVPPDDVNTLEDFDDWLELLIYHEYVHILHLDKATGAAAGLREVFGRNVLLFPNTYQPAWLIEGLATFLETDLEHHTGRGQSSLFKMMMATEVAAGIKPVRQVNLSMRSWPMGTSYYLYGVHFFQFIEERYGADAINRLVDEYSDNVIPFMINSNADNVLGRDISQLWDEFEIWLKQRYASHVEKLDSPATKQGLPLTRSGYFSGPVDVAADGRVYYVEAGAFEHAALYVMDEESGKQKLVDVHGRVRMDVHRDGGVLIAQPEYCDLYNINYDLYILAPDDRELKRITECGRYRSASWSPDASQIVAVHTSHSMSELHLLDAEGYKQSVLWRAGKGVILGQPDWSPSGDHLVASVFRPGLGWNIEQFDINARRWQQITRDDYIDAGPRYNLTGTAILFSSDRTGTYNIYRYDIEHRQLQRITEVASGAFRPSRLDASAPLYYVGYGASGYDIFKLQDVEVIESQPLVIGDTVNDDPAVEAVAFPENYSVKEYAPLSSLAPRWWFPLLRLDEDQKEIGFTTSGNDALGIHNYSVNALYDTTNEWFSGSLAYRYSQRFAMGFGRSTDILLDQNGNFAIARKEDAAFISYSFPVPKFEESWNLIVGAFTSHERDGRRAAGIQPLPAFDDNILGVAGLYNNSKQYIRSVSANDGRDIRLVAESSDVWDSDFSGEVYTLDWREYIGLGGQQVLALRFMQGYGTDRPDNFELGGEETDFLLAELFLPLSKPLIGRRDYPLRGYREGLPQLTGRRARLASMEYRFPIALVERGWMAPPVGVIQWAGSAFIDTGASWNDGGTPDEYYTGVGVELHGDLSLFYGLNLKLRLGLASGLDDQLGDDRAYLSLGAAF